MKRTVLAAQVNADSYDEFVEALMNSSLTIRLGAKVVEISHTEEDRDLIKGIFVSTQKADLPPQHAPGDDDDYSAIPIEEGKGLAYPNVFLYDKTRRILLWEVNSQGMDIKRFSKYFTEYDKENDTNIHAEFLPVTTTDFMERVSRLERISDLDIKIADPLQIVERSETALGSIPQLVEESNATKSVGIKLQAAKGHTLSINSIKQWLGDIFHMNNEENAKIQCKTKGLFYDDEGNLEETTIDLLIDRFRTSFDLPKNENATLQEAERKRGIMEGYATLLRMFNQLNVR